MLLHSLFDIIHYIIHYAFTLVGRLSPEAPSPPDKIVNPGMYS